MRYILVLFSTVILCACNENRVFEENTELEGKYWAKDEIITFDFNITDVQLGYNIYANIRNAVDYPYQNLYYEFTLYDTTGSILVKELQNIDLFESKTGHPNGSGIGDLFNHQQMILSDYKFRQSGTYTIKFQQYMRQDTLPKITSIGSRVEWVINPRFE